MIYPANEERITGLAASDPGLFWSRQTQMFEVRPLAVSTQRLPSHGLEFRVLKELRTQWQGDNEVGWSGSLGGFAFN